PFSLLASRPPPRPDVYTLSLHDALPICFVVATPSASNAPLRMPSGRNGSSIKVTASEAIRSSNFPFKRDCSFCTASAEKEDTKRSEEHTSELQSRFDLVCRLLLEENNNV